MKFPLSILAIAAVIVCGSPATMGQTVGADVPASISGRVTIGGKSAAGIRVVASISEPLNKRIAGKATTDQEGNYRITGLQAGRYTVTPIAKAYVRANVGGPDHSSRPLNVSAGEEISKIDFNLSRGGVITGRITDADGSPIIAEGVTLLPIDTQYQAPDQPVFFSRPNTTDDRGIYRLYGLPPGTYKVSVGQPKPESSSDMYRSGSKYMQTFYPGVLEEAKATIIEIKEGSEVKDVDIRTTKGARGFSVSGRVVDAVSNQPATNIYVGYSAVEDAKPGITGMNFSPSATDANGKFKIDGLPPGQYVAYSLGLGMENTSYSEPVKFEITDGDVSGIEIKLSRGATVSGVAVIENNQDPAVTAVLQTVTVYAFGDQKPTGGVPTFARSTIKSDGSFKFTGLAPGKVRITMMGFPAPPKGLTLSRVELGGVAQRGGIEIASGADVKDVRLVFAYGGGSLRGTLKVSGGTADGAAFVVMLNDGAGEGGRNRRTIEVDSRGHFFAEDIPAGTYELIVYGKMGEKDVLGLEQLKQTVIITDGNETKVTLSVDLSTQKAG